MNKKQIAKPSVIGIIGFGRFGQFWCKHLQDDFRILFYDTINGIENTILRAEYREIKVLCKESDTIFLCVPISQVNNVVKQIRPYLLPDKTIIDTCSVKVFPANSMINHLSQLPSIELISTHPMLGPDSGKHGIEGLSIIIWPLHNCTIRYRFWEGYFKSLGLEVIELSPEDHDKIVARSQGITQIIGRVLEKLDLTPTTVSTKTYKLLLTIIDETCNDSWQLFNELQMYNPFTMEMRYELEVALNDILAKLNAGKNSVINQIVIGATHDFDILNNNDYCEYLEIDEDGTIVRFKSVDELLKNLRMGNIDKCIMPLNNINKDVLIYNIKIISESRYIIEKTIEIDSITYAVITI